MRIGLGVTTRNRHGSVDIEWSPRTMVRAMKLLKKHLGVFLLLIFLGLFIGTLAWFIVERIFTEAGLPFSLETGPIGFDIGVLSMSLEVNPGSLLGAAAGILLFRSL